MCDVSIVVPVYNKGKCIEKTIKCILNQTFRDFELILVDDGSTDESGTICDSFAHKDDRIRVFHRENKGVSFARNLGIKQAKGKYICFIDADDYIEKIFIEELHESIIINNSDMAVCDYFEIKNGIKTRNTLNLDVNIDDVYEIVRYNVLGILWNKMFVRKKIRHMFEEEISTCEDSIFCVQYYIDNVPKISYVNAALYGYIRQSDGLTAFYHDTTLYGINRYCSLYYSLIKDISDIGKKKVAIHSICKIYFFLICSFVFENISVGVIDKEKRLCIKQIVCSKKYQRVTKNILLFPLGDNRAEKTTFKEFVYIVASLFKVELLIVMVARAKRRIKPFKKKVKTLRTTK